MPDDITDALGMDLPEECRKEITVENMTPDTTLTIGKDGVFSEEGSVTVDWAIEFRGDCIGAVAPGQQVNFDMSAQFCAVFADAITGPDTPFKSSSCRTLSKGCSCSAEQVQPVSESGQFTVDGSALVTPEGLRQSFCVQGDRLDVEGEEGSTLESAHVIYMRVAE